MQPKPSALTLSDPSERVFIVDCAGTRLSRRSVVLDVVVATVLMDQRSRLPRSAATAHVEESALPLLDESDAPAGGCYCCPVTEDPVLVAGTDVEIIHGCVGYS